MVVYCQVRQELANLLTPHVFWRTFMLEQDESPDPENICFFGSEAIVFGANHKADLIKQFRFLTTLVCLVDLRHDLTNGARSIDSDARW